MATSLSARNFRASPMRIKSLCWERSKSIECDAIPFFPLCRRMREKERGECEWERERNFCKICIHSHFNVIRFHDTATQMHIFCSSVFVFHSHRFSYFFFFFSFVMYVFVCVSIPMQRQTFILYSLQYYSNLHSFFLLIKKSLWFDSSVGAVAANNHNPFHLIAQHNGESILDDIEDLSCIHDITNTKYPIQMFVVDVVLSR